MIYKGTVWKYADDVNTDVIYPGRYTYLALSPSEIASHALEDLDPSFAVKVQPGDILVGGWNWGVGSAREQAVKTFKYNCISVILAKSFARIYFRNCINEGILAISCPPAVDALSHGEIATVNLDENSIETSVGSFTFESYPPYIQQLIEAGGIIPFTKKRLQQSEASK